MGKRGFALIPKISVFMPAYNSEEFIAEAIESILNQTFKDFEFIIINDGSTDHTWDIIQKYARQDNRIRAYSRCINKGIVYTANEGFELARGEYIARMDSDDISLPERFEKQIKYMETHPDIGLLGAWTQYFPGFDISKRPKNINLFYLLKDCPVDQPVVMIRKSVIDKYHLRYDEDYLACEDQELWFRLIKVSRIANLQELLLMHRWHGNNISIKMGDIQQQNIQKIRRQILNFITTDKKEQDAIKKIIPEMLAPLLLKT